MIDKDRILELFSSNDSKSKGLKCMIIGAYISSDNNTCKEERIHNLNILEQIRNVLVNVEDLNKYYDYCCKGIEILKKELLEEK